ncbi:MAG: hypothetical protein ABW168_04960 [Sedimenticola sp.]
MSVKLDRYNGRVVVHLDNFLVGQSTMFYYEDLIPALEEFLPELKQAGLEMLKEVCTI